MKATKKIAMRDKNNEIFVYFKYKDFIVLEVRKFKLKISPVQLSCPCPAKKTEPTLKVGSRKNKKSFQEIILKALNF